MKSKREAMTVEERLELIWMMLEALVEALAEKGIITADEVNAKGDEIFGEVRQ